MPKLARIAEDLSVWKEKAEASGRRLMVRSKDGQVNDFDRMEFDERWSVVIISYRNGMLCRGVEIDKEGVMNMRRSPDRWRLTDQRGDPIEIFED